MKKFEDMTVAERKKERARVRKVIKRLEEEEYNSDSQRIIRALSDRRKTNHKGPAMDAAIWCLTYRGRPLDVHYINRDRMGRPLPGHYFARNTTREVIQNFRDGDSAFFRKVAEAIESLEKQGFELRGGVLSSKPVPNNAKLLVTQHWDRWEKENAKIEVRLAELKQELGKKISKSRYYAIIEQVGLKNT